VTGVEYFLKPRAAHDPLIGTPGFSNRAEEVAGASKGRVRADPNLLKKIHEGGIPASLSGLRITKIENNPNTYRVTGL
jgi:hypothetical protein